MSTTTRRYYDNEVALRERKLAERQRRQAASPRKWEKQEQPTVPGITTLEDGSMLISLPVLEAYGGGNSSKARWDLRYMLTEPKPGPAVYEGPTAKPENVRIAGPQDEAAVLDLLLVDLKANAEHIAAIDEAKVLEEIRNGTRRRGAVTAVIDDEHGKPVAVVMMAPVQWWWSKSWHYFETALFVHTKHRNSTYAVDLLNFEKWWCDETSKRVGSRWYLICGVLGAWRIKTKIRMYQRLFQQAGAAFCYPAPPARGN